MCIAPQCTCILFLAGCKCGRIHDEIDNDNNWRVKQTTFTLSQPLIVSDTTCTTSAHNFCKVVFKFQELLLFPWIDIVQTSVELPIAADGTFPGSPSEPHDLANLVNYGASTDHGPDGTTVTVYFQCDKACVKGVIVHVQATQCPYTPKVGGPDKN